MRLLEQHLCLQRHLDCARGRQKKVDNKKFDRRGSPPPGVTSRRFSSFFFNTHLSLSFFAPAPSAPVPSAPVPSAPVPSRPLCPPPLPPLPVAAAHTHARARTLCRPAPVLSLPLAPLAQPLSRPTARGRPP